MITAAVSVCASTKRRPDAAAAPTTSRFGPPPGRPNTSLVPASASAVTIAAAPAGAPWPLWLTRGHSSGTSRPSSRTATRSSVALADPHRQVGGFQGLVDDPGQVIADGVQVHGVFEAGGG